VSTVLDPGGRPKVERRTAESVIGRVMKAFRNAARFAYDLLRDLF
jgi:hypothetical protein